MQKQKTQTVNIDGLEVKLMELTLGFIAQVQSGVKKDGVVEILREFSSLGEDEILSLGAKTGNDLVEIIARLSYGDGGGEGETEKKRLSI